jgi:hypothetical protein
MIKWIPTKESISDNEIAQAEKQIGVKLPEDFISSISAMKRRRMITCLSIYMKSLVIWMGFIRYI